MQYTTLFFDLDETLYPPHSGLWDGIRQRIHDYMQDLLGLPSAEISKLREEYMAQYGTTLRGLQAHHQIDPEEYLAYVHDLPLHTYIRPDPSLRALLLSLPQRRYIFTNADTNHARRVMDVLGVTDCFDGIIDIHAMQFACKPNPTAYLRALELSGETEPTRCVLFEDSPHNLAPAHQMGFLTILVGDRPPTPAAQHIIHNLQQLPAALPQLWDNRSLPKAINSSRAEAAR